MTIEKLKIIIPQLFIILLCLCISFINYCVIQIVTPYILPLTMIPIAAYSLFSDRSPSLSIAVMAGVVDDAMLNGHLGVFPLVYMISMNIPQPWKQNTTIKRIIFFIFLIVFTIINITYCRYYPSIFCYR